jgi:hypothetical protein
MKELNAGNVGLSLRESLTWIGPHSCVVFYVRYVYVLILMYIRT